MIYLIIISVLVSVYIFLRIKSLGDRRNILSVYFGVPGSGKSTFAAWLAKNDIKHNHKVYSNVPIKGTYQLEPKTDLGTYFISDARIIIDEAGLEFNNRDFKSFTHANTYFFKYHRHYQTAVDIFSQSFDDMDKKIRCLAQRMFVVKRSFIPYFFVRIEMRKKVGINEMTKEPCDEWFWVKPFGKKWIFAPAVWKMFNTISRSELQKKEFNLW